MKVPKHTDILNWFVSEQQAAMDLEHAFNKMANAAVTYQPYDIHDTDAMTQALKDIVQLQQ